MRVASRAGIAAHVHPHDLRHAFAGHVARRADTRSAQHLLGHASLGTTDTYLGPPTLDEIVAAVAGVSYGTRTDVLGAARRPVMALEATAGIEPALSPLRPNTGLLLAPSWGERWLAISRI